MITRLPASRFSFVAVLAAAAFSLSAPAQEATGFLGVRYFDVSLESIDHRKVDATGYGSGLLLNLPATSTLDVGLGYDLGWTDLRQGKLRQHTVSALLTLHGTHPGAKPFVSVGLGHDWSRTSIGQFNVTDRTSAWGAATGIELSVDRFTVTPSVTYTDSFEDTNGGSTRYGLEGSYAVTRTCSLHGTISYLDFNRTNNTAWAVGAGVRVKF